MKQMIKILLLWCFCFSVNNFYPAWAYSLVCDDQTECLDSWWVQALKQEDHDNSISVIDKKHKDPGTAIGLAVFPGSFIHGSGHFYAGRPLTGTMLLLAEAGAVMMAWSGGSDVYNVINDNVGKDKSSVEIIESLSDTGRLSRGVGLALGGLMLFLSSWMYDVTGAPIVIEENNAKIPKKDGPRVNAMLTLNGVEIKLDQLF